MIIYENLDNGSCHKSLEDLYLAAAPTTSEEINGEIMLYPNISVTDRFDNKSIYIGNLLDWVRKLHGKFSEVVLLCINSDSHKTLIVDYFKQDFNDFKSFDTVKIYIKSYWWQNESTKRVIHKELDRLVYHPFVTAGSPTQLLEKKELIDSFMEKILK